MSTNKQGKAHDRLDSQRAIQTVETDNVPYMIR